MISKFKRRLWTTGAVALTAVSLAGLEGCTRHRPEKPVVPASAPKGRFLIGHPYQFAGKWYYPALNLKYDQTGTAVAYGNVPDGAITSNGEAYDPQAIAGSHKTLALPSVVAVTNLSNNRRIVIRINDRGPTVPGALIGLTPRVAAALGIDPGGQAPVEVKILVPETVQAQSIANQNTADTANGEDGPVEHAVAAPRQDVEAQDLGSPGSAPSPVAAGGAPIVLPHIDGPARLPSAYPQHSHAPRPYSDHSQPAASGPQSATKLPTPKMAAAPSTGGVYVQAGAFAQAENARKLAAKLAGLGKVSVVQGGAGLYRVKIGPFTDMQTARRVLPQAMGLGAAQAQIVSP